MPRLEWTTGTCAVPISQLGTNAKKRLKRYLSAQQGGLCFYCDVELTVGLPRTATLDHVVALKNGGADDETNVVLACHQCNRAKGCLTVAQLRTMADRIETHAGRVARQPQE